MLNGMGPMRLTSFLAEITDGMQAWRSFIQGVRAYSEGQRELIPLIGLVIFCLSVIAFDFFIAKKLIRKQLDDHSRK